jgi:hypothetical protein
MKRFLGAVLVMAVAAGCGSSAEKSGTSGASGEKGAKATYICHMGADCGKADVAAGQNVPSCCGKTMLKADTFTCSCGKTKIVNAGQPAPQCCGAAMKKAN